MSDSSGKLKIFLSWSGERAEAVAKALRDWLPDLFDNIEPFMSQSDIASGERSLSSIESQLAGTRFGIIVVTPENQDKPWLNFEAGALSKVVQPETEARVVPLLVDMSSLSELKPPLGQFQGRLCDRNGVGRIVKDLAVAVEADEAGVARRFEKFWPDLEEVVGAVLEGGPPTQQARRADREILEEILQLARGLRRDSTPFARTGLSLDELWRPDAADRMDAEKYAQALADELELPARKMRWDDSGRLEVRVAESPNKDLARRFVEKFANKTGMSASVFWATDGVLVRVSDG